MVLKMLRSCLHQDIIGSMNTKPNIRYRTRGLPREPYRYIQPGEKFGHWTAIRLIPKAQRWLCRCACGRKIKVLTSSLRNGNSKSCGCVQPPPRIKHGMAGTETYMIWAWILQRCNNPKSTAYKHYGGRGIKVCKRWHKFENFFADMGVRPEGLSVERKNNDGHYCKKNCVWATTAQQSRNRRSTKLVSRDG